MPLLTQEEVPPPHLRNTQVKELTNLGFSEATLFSSLTTQPTVYLVPLTDVMVLGQKHNFWKTNFLHFSPSPADEVYERT